MSQSILDKVVASLHQATQHNANIMVPPEVVLWPDPERQWQQVIPQLQAQLPALLVLGTYDPDQRQGPAIWIKCMVGRHLPEADWPAGETPIIYLPGISKQDLRDIPKASFALQPLAEYQYTGVLWLHENGKEWTVPAFIQNAQSGLGIRMAQDGATKDALLQALPSIFQDGKAFYKKAYVDADLLLSAVFPQFIPTLLDWMGKGDAVLAQRTPSEREAFAALCKSRLDCSPDYTNILGMVRQLGSRQGTWAEVWRYFANAPRKYPKIIELLRSAKPDDLGSGMFALPEDSWPQINEEKETALRKALLALSKKTITQVDTELITLHRKHNSRKQTIWHELGQAPLVDALEHLQQMVRTCATPFPFSDLQELTQYYVNHGLLADQAMRKAYASAKSNADKEAVTAVISATYQPWLRNLAEKFQALLAKDATALTGQAIATERESFVLFVDALRYELAVDFCNRLQEQGYTTQLQHKWAALPTLTNTAKPFCSPIAGGVKQQSVFKEFRPQLSSGPDLTTYHFRNALTQQGYAVAATVKEVDSTQKTWMEIGDVDTKGHKEQADMLYRIDELYSSFLETLQGLFAKGIQRIKIVTDHGWLMLPGGLPKADMPENLTEARWGRCAIPKEGTQVSYLRLPWQWNPGVYIAYAPDISFFKKNEAYAHGGLSLQECLVPEIIIEHKAAGGLTGKIAAVSWNNLRCHITLEGVPDGYLVDIRTKATEASSSIVASPPDKRKVINNKAGLLAQDDFEGSAAHVVLTNADNIIVHQIMTTVGQPNE